MAEEKKINEIVNSVKNVAGKVSEKAADVAEDVKNAAEKARANAIQKKRLEDLKKYSPIFKEDISNGELLNERVIRIVNFDARLENEACKDSIGFYEISGDRRIPTFYSKTASELGLTFYPHRCESVFIADPCVANTYIEIDEYYSYMKEKRVSELMNVAQSLGAKSVEIALNSSTHSLFNKSASGNIKVSKQFGADGKIEIKRRHSKSIDIWESASFKAPIFGTKPKVPELLYFKNDTEINSLIQMVVVNESKLMQKRYSMNASSSSGITVNEATSISASLKGLKCKAGANFVKNSEIQNKSKLEYTIIF